MQKSQEERKEAQKLVTKLEEKLGAELEVVPLANGVETGHSWS